MVSADVVANLVFAAAVALATGFVALFTWRLYRIERSREEPRLEIVDHWVTSDSVWFDVINRGGKETAIQSIEVIQEVAGHSGDLGAAKDVYSLPEKVPHPLVRPGHRVRVVGAHFSPALVDRREGKYTATVRPVLGAPITIQPSLKEDKPKR